MRPSTALLSVVTLVAGSGGGWVAYELASSVGEPTGTSTAAAETAPAPAVESPAVVVRGTRFRWAPCKPPSVLRGKACVTTVERTVVVPGTAVAATTTAPVAAAPAYQGDGRDEAVEYETEHAEHDGDDEGDDHEDEPGDDDDDHEDDHEDEDDGDDDHEDEPGEDD